MGSGQRSRQGSNDMMTAKHKESETKDVKPRRGAETARSVRQTKEDEKYAKTACNNDQDATAESACIQASNQ